MHYNPASDPKVVNGIQEAYGLKIGDTVEFTNPHGLKFSPRKVIGFDLVDRAVYIDSDSPWYSVAPGNLKRISGQEN